MSRPAIVVSALTKRYELGIRDRYPTLRESISRRAAAARRRLSALAAGRPAEETPHVWALQGVDLEVKEGEIFGIIGQNGSGKSTLLKVLSGITEPTSGYADIYGRVASLLEVGTGFHMELTGRENIWLNGALLGMRRREIAQKFDQIVAFSEVETFLDTPVKRYSSGMYMRLAFAIAAHLEPDILIVDEVLAVGDAAFQKKCLGKMSTVAHEGRTVLFVSHNMAAVQSLCDRSVWLEHGRVRYDGTPMEVISQYLQSATSREPVALDARPDRTGDGTVRMLSVAIESLDPDRIIRCGSRLSLTVRYAAAAPIPRASLVASVYTDTEIGAFALDSDATGGLPDPLPAEGSLRCVTAPINLTPGRCLVTLQFRKDRIEADGVRHAVAFDVENEDFFGHGRLPTRQWVLGLVHHDWDVIPAS